MKRRTARGHAAGARENGWWRVGGGALLVVAVLGLWELLVHTPLVGKDLAAGPVEIVRGFVHDWPQYPPNIWQTASESLRGFAIGSAVAVVLSIAFVLVPPVASLLEGAVLVSYVLPITALAPILGLVLPGDWAAVAIAAIWVCYPVMVNTTWGLQSADPRIVDTVWSVGGSSWQVMSRVRLRSAVPGLLAGLKIAAPLAVGGAIIGEWLGGQRGLGVYVVAAMGQLNTARVWGIVVIATLMAAGAYIAFGALGRGLAWTAADEFSLGRVTTGEGSGARGSRRRLLDLVLGTAVLVGLWAVLIHSLAINPLVAKTPADVWRYLFDGPAAAGSRSLLLHALGETMWLAALGGAIGFALGVVLALAIAAVPSARRVVLSVAIAANTAPIVVLAPIVVILFGHGVAGAAVIVALLVFFPTFVNTLTGLERVSQATLDVLRVYSASSRVVLLKVRVPGAVPLAMGSLLVAVPNAIVGATVAEWLATGNGLGGLMITSGVQVNFAAVWAGAAVLVVATLVALGVAQLIVAVTNRRFT